MSSVQPVSTPVVALSAPSMNRQVLTLALPMLGEQFLNFLVGLVDTWLAGHVSKEATSAVGTGTYMAWSMMLIFSLVGTGAAAVVSRSIGARDGRTASLAAAQALTLGLALGLVLAGVGAFSAPYIAEFFSQTDAARELLTVFLRIDAFGYALYAAVVICGGVIRAAGDARTPLKIMGVVNIVNMLLSAGLVFGWYGPHLGVRGIAIGTAIARTLGGVLLVYVLFRGVGDLHVTLRRLIPNVEMIGRMMRVGIPAAADGMLMWASQMTFVKIVSNTGVGDAATVNFAAHMIALRMEAISYLPAQAWMTAAATLVGQHLGAGRPDDASRAGHRAAFQGALLTTFIGVGFFLLAGPIFAFMSNDEAVQAVGVPAFRLMAFVQPMLGLAIVYTGALRGAGDTRATMLISLIGGIGLRVPVAYVGGILLHGGLIGAWCGMWSDNICKCVLGAVRFTRGGWKRVDV